MPEVYSCWRLLRHLVIPSISHVGAGATSAALRDRLVADRIVERDEFDSLFAAARLTPGTNLLALFAGLGRLVGGLGGAVIAVTMASAPAALISAFVCIAYLRCGARTEVAAGIATANAAALSVLVWAAFRFLKTPATNHRMGVYCIAAGVVVLQKLTVPPVVLLLGAAAVGGIFFKTDDV